MKDEINRIIQSISDFYKLDNALKYYLDRHKAQILLDYITNLEQVNKNQGKRNSRQRLANQKQQELILKLQQEKEEIRKEIYKQVHTSIVQKKQIKNLQNENERLKANNQAMQEEMARVWEENERLKEEHNQLRNCRKYDLNLISNLKHDKVRYEEIIEKAIEYINHAQNYGTMAQVMPHLKPYVNGDDLLNILQNGSDSQ